MSKKEQATGKKAAKKGAKKAAKKVAKKAARKAAAAEGADGAEPDKNQKAIEQAYEKTRKSLIARLDNWEDQRTWDEFYQTYWRLIYSVALKSGLRNDEAMDAVQETILSIAKQSKKKLYDPEQGSFKTWHLNQSLFIRKLVAGRA